MNVESLKTELQQVLDNDVVLRKEFNTLKRSLSDYRNQLIMRDEDCKRLQVTIDVLNTKLVVMERDNTSYKAELTSFKELRGTIKEQLQSKQDEIDARLEEIQSLRNDLNTMAAGYEAKIEELRTNSSHEIESLKSSYEAQIQELKTNTHYKESGIKEEFENMVAELSHGWANKEQSLLLNHEEEIQRLNESHSVEINALLTSHASALANASSSGNEELATLKSEHASTIAQLEENHAQKIESLDSVYSNEIKNLREALEEQRSTLTTNFTAQVENLSGEYSAKESALIISFEAQIEELKSNNAIVLNETISSYEDRLTTLVNEYEEKLSNTLIHSNSQNSKLNEEFIKTQEENNTLAARAEELSLELNSKSEEIIQLKTIVEQKDAAISAEESKFSALNSEFETFKQQSSLSVSEQVNELNLQIANLNETHSDYVNELRGQIDNLNEELKNIGLLFENATNSLGAVEIELEQKNQELQNAFTQISALNSSIQSIENSAEEKVAAFENIKTEYESSVKKELQDLKTEYEKLLAENTNLIEEIDLAQDKVETYESEITLLKGELDEVRVQSIGKTEYFKETLANRNFEITNLEANNAALTQELSHIKQEFTKLSEQVQNSDEIDAIKLERNQLDVRKTELEEELNTIQIAHAELKQKLNEFEQSNLKLNAVESELASISDIKLELEKEVDVMQSVISGLNEHILGLNDKITNYESEIESLKINGKIEEQEAFIDRLFKQIDELNDQRLSLLDEKEQMANQLLKMNDAIGSISQHVESENIDVSSLNNHRKNIILANNSSEAPNKPTMKKQINDLVREIDKCIALLSA